jgi:hypothetical protein
MTKEDERKRKSANPRSGSGDAAKPNASDVPDPARE